MFPLLGLYYSWKVKLYKVQTLAHVFTCLFPPRKAESLTVNDGPPYFLSSGTKLLSQTEQNLS